MARKSKTPNEATTDLAALASPTTAPTTTLEREGPENLRRYEYKNLRYNYETITDEGVREQTRFAAADIIIRRRTAAIDLIEIGKRLMEIRDALGQAQYRDWLDTEFGYSDVTANDFINIAKRFGDDPNALVNVSPTMAKLLAQPTLTQEGVDMLLTINKDMQESGDTLKMEEARLIADEFRTPESTLRKERTPKTIQGEYTVKPAQDPIVKALIEAPSSGEMLSAAIRQASKGQLEKAIEQIQEQGQAGDADRHDALQHAYRNYEYQHKPVEAQPEAPLMSMRKGRKDMCAVELPRALWGKVIEAFRQFDMNPVIGDKDALRIVKIIEQSLEVQ